MSGEFDQLINGPLLWVLLTLVAYLLALLLHKRFNGNPLLHPVLVSLSVIIVVLLVSGLSYAEYKEATEPLSFMLGPAIVALAIPLYNNLSRVKELLLPLLVAMAVGATTAMAVAVAIGYWGGLPDPVLIAIAPKSVTSPIAIEVAAKLGGFSSLAAGLVLVTGAMSCMLAPLVFKLLKLDDPAAKGFVLGVSGHAMGTAFAFQYGAVAGAFAGLAMGVTGAFTAFLLPLLWSLI